MNKRIAAIVMALALTFSVCACSKNEETTKGTTTTAATTTTEEETTTTSEDETEPSESETPSAPDMNGEGFKAVYADLQALGFEIENDLENVEYNCFQGQDGFVATNDDEIYIYAQYDSEDKVTMLDEQGLPADSASHSRVGIGDLVFHYDDSDTPFQYLVINTATNQALYYMGPEDKGARSNAYARELGIIGDQDGYAVFADDADYPNGKGISNKTPSPADAPDVDLKNADAIDLMGKLAGAGFSISAMPIDGMSMEELAPKDSVGFMAAQGMDEIKGEFEDVSMVVYMENDDLDALKKNAENAKEEIKGQSDVDFEVIEEGDLLIITGEAMGMVISMGYDLANGYVFEIIGTDMAAVKSAANQLGFNF